MRRVWGAPGTPLTLNGDGIAPFRGAIRTGSSNTNLTQTITYATNLPATYTIPPILAGGQCVGRQFDSLGNHVADGWVARTARIVETDKKGKQKDKGWTCDILPKSLIVARYFAKEQAAIEAWLARAPTSSGSSRRWAAAGWR